MHFKCAKFLVLGISRDRCLLLHCVKQICRRGLQKANMSDLYAFNLLLCQGSGSLGNFSVVWELIVENEDCRQLRDSCWNRVGDLLITQAEFNYLETDLAPQGQISACVCGCERLKSKRRDVQRISTVYDWALYIWPRPRWIFCVCLCASEGERAK